MTTTSTSLSTSAYSILKSLLAAERDWLGGDRLWAAAKPDQTRFLEAINRCYADRKGLSEIRDVIATNQVEKVESWLQAHQVESTLPDINPDSEVWVGSVLGFTPTWEKPGRSTERRIDGKDYDFVAMREGFRYYAPPAEWVTPISHESNAPINFCVQIACVDGTALWLMMLADAPQSPLDLIDLVHNLQKNRCADPEPCTKPRLHFPMIDLHQEIDLSWLSGLQTEDESGHVWNIVGGIQKHSLKLNEKGVPYKDLGPSAGGFYITGGGNRQVPATEMVFDSPFVVWVEKKGMRDPLFSAYITPDDWKRPQT